MGVPDPPKRRDRKALRYLESLASRLLLDPSAPVHTETEAALYARALVLVAFFGDAERQLFRDIYAAYAEGECVYELRTACACDGKDQLCLILDRIVAETESPHLLADYMMQIIEGATWRPIRESLDEQGFTADNFVWWAFDPNRV